MDQFKVNNFKKRISNKFYFKLFMLQKLPMGLISGLRIENISDDEATVSIPFKYLNKNPFRSIYFACQLMAGEMSTGVLALQFVQAADVPVSMLVTDIKATFHKKATERIYFTCKEGDKIRKTIDEAIATGVGRTIITESFATNVSGELITSFSVEWSFKKKVNRSKDV